MTGHLELIHLVARVRRKPGTRRRLAMALAPPAYHITSFASSGSLRSMTVVLSAGIHPRRGRARRAHSRSMETKNSPGNERKPLSTAVLPIKFLAVLSMRTAMRNSLPVFIIPAP